MGDRFFWWEWYCSLYPSRPGKEIDPKLFKCTHCDYHFRFNKLQVIIMLLFGKYTVTCPQCQTKMVFELSYHIVKVKTKNNKNEEIWKNG